jgi:indolepyruvate ferredoxin oxidoreductase
VARYYFKLLAYKDEYEVARLYADTGFVDQVRAGFEGKVRVSYHLAPPLLARPAGTDGTPRKIQFGSWMGRLFPLLARMKRLRGTPFDVFGYTEERRQERALIARYERDVALVLARCGASNHARALELLSLPEQVRGFGHVKHAHLAKVATRWDELEQSLEFSGGAA